MNFATQNRAAHRMRNVNPPGYAPPGHVPPGALDSQVGPSVGPPPQTVPMPQTGPATTTSAPAMTPDGRVPGIDGMLNQVAEALVKQVSLDEKLQERVGAAAGKALAITLLEGLFVGWVLKTAWDALPER